MREKCHPNKVWVKITNKERGALFSRMIKRGDGSEVELFHAYEHDDEKLDASYAQNVSVGTIVMVGDNIGWTKPGDIAIIDYLVDNDRLAIVERTEDYKIVAVWAITTYHEKDAPKSGTGKRRYFAGGYKRISSVYGIVSDENLIPVDPYIFLEHEENVVHKSVSGFMYEHLQKIVERKVLAAYSNAGAMEGELLLLPDDDIFTRIIDGKEIAIIFNQDVKIKIQYTN